MVVCVVVFVVVGVVGSWGVNCRRGCAVVVGVIVCVVVVMIVRLLSWDCGVIGAVMLCGCVCNCGGVVVRLLCGCSGNCICDCRMVGL